MTAFGDSSPLLPFVDGSYARARFAFAPPPAGELPEQRRLLAGVAEVDITPPPGLPKAGYSKNAHTGTGFRTRLKARVVHLRCGTSSLALVALDLLGGSAVLQHLVADAVLDRTDVPMAGLLLGATHTHAGPGQYLGSDFYNRFASNQAGFDPAWTQFLADQVADAVVSAVTTRRPARLAFGTSEVWGFTRNRSLAPHVRNPSVTDHRTGAQRRYVNINPELHLLRVDADASDGGTEPLGALVVFSIHGTGIPMKAEHYNADVWAYIVGELARRVEADYGSRPVVGAIEGTHGDMTPAMRRGQAGHLEAERVGRGIGAAAADLYRALDGELSDRVELACGLREVDLDRGRAIDGIELPRRAAVGAALVTGAAENTTPVLDRIVPFQAGHPKPGRRGPHGAKWVLGSRWLQPFVVPPSSYPRVLPIQVLRVGDTVVPALPFEVTVDSGRRIAAAVARAAVRAGIRRVVVTSVANEYSGYCTTPEEYDLQYYEGGHTIYGPNTQPFLAAHAAHLAADTVAAGVVSDTVAERWFDLGVRRFLPFPEGAPVERVVDGPAVFHDSSPSSFPRWELDWIDAAPGDLVWHEPLVRVERSEGGGRWELVADDSDWDVGVEHMGEADEGPGHRYVARWWNPEFRGDCAYRFVVTTNAARNDLASDPFS
ncbi:MAG: neutral/alkaline non-lysosomal ceramidase N-terminal domain-containing protein [Acidimicrobiales bacterium]